ncbi:MAG: type II toxin-antitoxin system VapB family antitoxin [Thermodesulfobacteriota bacterium]|nr:type II toxin-antitoxin system VapB family antitoxin [Thermodesulfobacteriota bacterium]
MAIGSIFVNNRTQAVRLPVETRFPKGVKKVIVRVLGKDRVLSPVENTWDSFFLSEEKVTDDFMTERASQEQQDRETF